MNLISLSGVGVILGCAVLFSRNRSAINGLSILKGLALQFFLAFFILCTSFGRTLFESLSRGFDIVCGFANAGAAFVFGSLTDVSTFGFIFGVKVVSLIIFFGALTSLLYHLGVVQFLVRGLAAVVRPLLGTTGSETLCAAANSMLGQTEAPLLVRHYLGSMTDSELLVVMVSGMATLSGSILAVYGGMGVPMLHLLAASIMSVPGAIVISKILIPAETEGGTDSSSVAESDAMKPQTKNILDAIAAGAFDGMSLAANVAAMLIAFIGLIAFVDYIFGACGGLFGFQLTLDIVFGKLFAVVAYLLGIAPADTEVVGALLGKKLAINEFVAYRSMIDAAMSERSRAIVTYALCGFANFSSIGIQIGGIGALVPAKRQKLTELGLVALLGGTLANFLNAAIAALFI